MIVAFKETPSFNPRRRKSILSMRHSLSSSVLDGSSIASSSTTGSSSTPSPTLVYNSLASRSINRRQAPSPSPSNTDRWLEMNPLCMSTVSVRSDTGSSSSCTAESEDNASANGSSLTGNDNLYRLAFINRTTGQIPSKPFLFGEILQTKLVSTSVTLSVIARALALPIAEVVEATTPTRLQNTLWSFPE